MRNISFRRTPLPLPIPVGRESDGRTRGPVSYTHLDVYKRQVYRYPPDQAARIAVDTVRRFLEEHPEGPQVTFVCFDARTEDLYQAQLAEL